MSSERDLAIIDLVELSPPAIGVIVTNEIALGIAAGATALKVTINSTAARKIAAELSRAADAFDARAEYGSVFQKGVVGNA